jgi:glucose/arabinose dehydrogenase
MAWPLVVAAALAVGLLAPAQSAAADFFVGASTPGADDTGACDTAAAPCVTIQAAVGKSQAQGGGDVRVLPNPDGKTTDAYAENVVLDGSAPVTLIGAGKRANGTRVAPSTGLPLDLAAGTAARSLRLAAPTGGTGVSADAGSTLDDAFVDAPGGIAYDGAGRVEDSRLVGQTGARLDAARLARTEVVSTQDGIVARLGTSQLLQVVVRPRDQVPQGGVPPTGDALRVGGAGGDARAELRHVTLTGFPVRLRLDGRTAKATLQAANATLADAGGTDLQLQGSGAAARLRTVNRAPARTAFTDGAVAGHLMDTDPVDLVPDLTPDGNLSPSSPLVDRGTPAGLLSGDPDNQTDIHGAKRLQGAAPDIGADELPTAGAGGLRWVTLGNFRDPMWTATPPGDMHRVFVVERRGTVIVVKDGQVLPTAALNITAKVGGNGGGGFQSIAFPPDFETSHHVYGFYSQRDDPNTPEVETPGDIMIAEWTMDPANPDRIDPTSQRQVMLIPHGLNSHFGGTLLFGPDGYLYISTGDGDNPTADPQDLSEPLGKILRIDPRATGGDPFTVPSDNPYANDGDPQTLAEIWALGLRNPFRMGFDAQTGDLWIGDVGHRRFEELNLMRGADGRDPGANFGWKVTEGDVMFQSGDPVPPGGPPGMSNYRAPVIVQRHDEGDQSITAGTVVYDPTIPQLQGQFLYADFFRGVTRATVAAPGGVSADGEVEGLSAVPGTTSYTLDACNRVYTTQLNQSSAPAGTVRRLTTTGQCVPPPEACTVLGTPGNDDNLTGTPGADVICGMGGNDQLFGLGGNDLLSGGAGNDRLVGGPGGDVLQGGDGPDDFADYSASSAPVTVTIGTGADDGAAGEADDVQIDVERVRGGSSGDQLIAGTRAATLVGLKGADTLRGGPANDTLDGGVGGDELEGADGRDKLVGGDDADHLLALDGFVDRLVCGAGVDTRANDPDDVIDPSCE